MIPKNEPVHMDEPIEKQKDLSNIKQFVPFFKEVKDQLGIDILKCQSFAEFKSLFMKQMNDSELIEALKLPGNSLWKETLEELKHRKLIECVEGEAK